MNESNMSSQKNYENASDKLNELTDLARKSGAIGSRFTGAGWGGCCVSLVKKEEQKDFIYKVKDYYTRQREPGYELEMNEDINKYIFASKAS